MDRLGDFSPVSLDELDERASLQRRVDHKYVVKLDVLDDLLAELRSDHDVLEIDGGRTFDYRSVYFDTPDYRCFVEHVSDRKPRFKLRTRHYVTTQQCVFEVKVKKGDGETSKESIDYEDASSDEVTDEARKLIDETLGNAQVDPPQDIRSSPVTQFRRSTLGLRDGGERVTIDRDLRLICGDQALGLRDDRALLETKTEDGEGRADRALRDAGVETVSFSKYRLGIGRLARPGDDPGYAEPLEPAFERVQTG
jgi:VTC domain